MVAKSNCTDSTLKKRIRAFEKELQLLKARILQDPWVESILKAEGFSKLDFSLDLSPAGKDNDRLAMFAAAFFMIRFLWEKFREFWRQRQADYSF